MGAGLDSGEGRIVIVRKYGFVVELTESQYHNRELLFQRLRPWLRPGQDVTAGRSLEGYNPIPQYWLKIRHTLLFARSCDGDLTTIPPEHRPRLEFVPEGCRYPERSLSECLTFVGPL